MPSAALSISLRAPEAAPADVADPKPVLRWTGHQSIVMGSAVRYFRLYGPFGGGGLALAGVPSALGAVHLATAPDGASAEFTGDTRTEQRRELVTFSGSQRAGLKWPAASSLWATPLSGVGSLSDPAAPSFWLGDNGGAIYSNQPYTGVMRVQYATAYRVVRWTPPINWYFADDWETPVLVATWGGTVAEHIITGEDSEDSRDYETRAVVIAKAIYYEEQGYEYLDGWPDTAEYPTGDPAPPEGIVDGRVVELIEINRLGRIRYGREQLRNLYPYQLDPAYRPPLQIDWVDSAPDGYEEAWSAHPTAEILAYLQARYGTQLEAQ